MNFYRFLICFFIYFLAVFNAFSQSNIDQFFKVIRVVDGDTFVIENGSDKGDKVRLIGVDAPETRNSAKRKVGYFGKEAKIYLTNLLDGKQVRLQYDVGKRDRYGRILAYVYLDDLFINAALLKAGYAKVFTVPPNVKYAELFVELERKARKRGRGLWKK